MNEETIGGYFVFLLGMVTTTMSISQLSYYSFNSGVALLVTAAVLCFVGTYIILSSSVQEANNKGDLE